MRILSLGILLKAAIMTFAFMGITTGANAQSINVGNLYNCIDCEYTGNDYGAMNAQIGLYDTPANTITYEQPKPVALLVKNYDCVGCGLFEVSVRQNPNINTQNPQNTTLRTTP